MHLERALPNPEDIRPLAADPLADQFLAVTDSAYDLLDYDAFACGPYDCGIHLLAPQESLVLKLLRAGQQVGIN